MEGGKAETKMRKKEGEKERSDDRQGQDTLARREKQ